MNKRFPNQDNLLPRFYRQALANILSNIMLPMAGLLNAAFLGHLANIRHLAGVVLATILFNYLYQALNFLRMGTTGVTAQAMGRDDREAMLLVGLRNALIALGIGALILIVQYPLREVGFALLIATKEVKASALDYFNARIWGAPAALLNYVLIGWFLGRQMSGLVLLLNVIGYATNIVLDYLLIIRLDWVSTGAGLATALSQYLMLSVGLIWALREISWKEAGAVTKKLWDTSAFKATFSLNGNLLLRSLAYVSTFAIFTNLSAAMGTTLLAENSLMLQVLILCAGCVNGVGFAVEALSGNLKGKGENERLLFLLQIALKTSLLLGSSFAGVSILFPETIFGLLTNHTEVTEQMTIYLPWLLLVVGLGSISYLLEGYFLGLAQGHTVRNATLISTFLGFAPVALAAWYFHSNHILWLAMSAFMITRLVMLGVELPRTFNDDSTVVEMN